jgi:hypothetical protein
MALTDFRCSIPEFQFDGAYQFRTAETSIDAAAEKMAFCGRVWIPDGVSRDISRVQFPHFVSNKGATTAVQVSLQDLDHVNGGPARPDGTADQTVVVPNGDLVNGWYRTGTFSANRTVAHGEELAVVWEFSVFHGGETYSLAGIGQNDMYQQPIAVGNQSGSWARLNTVQPNVLLEFSDGSFGTLQGVFLLSGVTATAFNSGSNPNEYALSFQFPVAVMLDGATLQIMEVANGADLSVKLYQGTTELASVDYDSETLFEAAVGYYGHITVPLRYSLAANTPYYLSVKPTTANNVTVRDFSVNDAAHWAVHRAPTNWCLATRNGGAWTKIPTRRPRFTLNVAQVDSGGGGGGGFPILGGSVVR